MLQELIKFYQNAGIDEIIENSPTPKAGRTPKITLNVEEEMSESRKIAENCQDFASLKSAVENFEGCSLKKTAINTVFGDGNPNSKILIIGEAPGATEDEKGVPFCGDSGQLLSEMLKQIGLKREENFYITNIIYWRPPANRKPTQEEVSICLPFLEKLISIMKPKMIILVGATAASGILQNNEPITKLRNRPHLYKNQYIEQEIPSFVLFHPSYLLRQAAQKKNAWFDLLQLKQEMKAMGIL